MLRTYFTSITPMNIGHVITIGIQVYSVLFPSTECKLYPFVCVSWMISCGILRWSGTISKQCLVIYIKVRCLANISSISVVLYSPRNLMGCKSSGSEVSLVTHIAETCMDLMKKDHSTIIILCLYWGCFMISKQNLWNKMARLWCFCSNWHYDRCDLPRIVGFATKWSVRSVVPTSVILFVAMHDRCFWWS